jgi:hypothetical protein
MDLTVPRVFSFREKVAVKEFTTSPAKNSCCPNSDRSIRSSSFVLVRSKLSRQDDEDEPSRNPLNIPCHDSATIKIMD